MKIVAPSHFVQEAGELTPKVLDDIWAAFAHVYAPPWVVYSDISYSKTQSIMELVSTSLKLPIATHVQSTASRTQEEAETEVAMIRNFRAIEMACNWAPSMVMEI